MFALSIGKLLLLAAIVVAVWYGFKYRARIEAVRAVFAREAAARRQQSRAAQRPRTIAAEDLVKCERCNSYVAARSAACGRPDCPWA